MLALALRAVLSACKDLENSTTFLCRNLHSAFEAGALRDELHEHQAWAVRMFDEAVGRLRDKRIAKSDGGLAAALDAASLSGALSGEVGEMEASRRAAARAARAAGYRGFSGSGPERKLRATSACSGVGALASNSLTRARGAMPEAQSRRCSALARSAGRTTKVAPISESSRTDSTIPKAAPASLSGRKAGRAPLTVSQDKPVPPQTFG